MNITLKMLTIENFKGCTNAIIEFSDLTEICGANATGKTTIADAFTWLLFGKDTSGSEKFEIRPLDSEGNKIHNVEISVEGVFGIEYGEEKWERVLKKTQKEKWVKKRGSGVAELQGNENAYEVDGYPRTEKEYKAFISDFIDEGLFKMITNPTYFPGMPWKEQRDILMLLATTQTDVEVAQHLGGYEEILDELSKAPSTDDILSKYKKSMSELKKIQSEIPVRIDEASKQKVSVDMPALEQQQKDISEQLASFAGTDENAIRKEELMRKLSDLKMKRIQMEDEARDKRTADLRKISDEMARIQGAQEAIAHKEEERKRIQSMISQETDRIGFLRKQWEEESARAFSGDTKCPYCGQELPKESVEKMVTEFEEKKHAIMKQNEDDGKVAQDNVNALGEKLKSVMEELSMAKVEIGLDADQKLKELAASYTELQSKPLQIGQEVETEIVRVQEELANVPANNSEERKAELVNKKREVDAMIAQAKQNADIDSRIAKLQQEQRDVAQKVMDSEKMVFLVEKFIREKMELISGQINSRFDGVAFKLFDIQINGGLKETCECTVNGVPYASANNGAKIVAGLNIIKTLQAVYGKYAPIFIDNAEAVNDYNLPKMANQMILMKVTEDKELKVS